MDDKRFAFGKDIFCITDNWKIEYVNEYKHNFSLKSSIGNPTNFYKIYNDVIEIYSRVDNSLVETRKLILRDNERILCGLKIDSYILIYTSNNHITYLKIYNPEFIMELRDASTRNVGCGLITFVRGYTQYVVNLNQLVKNKSIDSLKKFKIHSHNDVLLSEDNNFIVKMTPSDKYYHLNDDGTVNEIKPFLLSRRFPYPVHYINKLKQHLKPIVNDIINIIITYI